MAFSRNRYESNAVELSPGHLPGIKGPDVVEPLIAVRATKPTRLLALNHRETSTKYLQIELVIPADDCMIRPRGRYLALRWASLIAVLYQEFPSTVRTLQGVQIERDQVVKKISFHLPTEYVYSRSQYIQRVSISTRWLRSRGHTS